MKDAVVAFATALTNIVFPVPGGPYNSTCTEKAEKLGQDQSVRPYYVPKNTYTAGRVNTNLPVEVKLHQRQLHSFTNLLLLNVCECQ